MDIVWGGILLRNIDRVSNVTSRRINGLITVATPNSGAGIANSFDDNSVLNASRKACSDLSAGPLTELFMLPWSSASLKIATSIGGNITTQNLCELFLTNNVFEDYVGSLTTRNDLKQGSQVLQQINSYNSSIPHLAMIVQENSPVHWRLLSTTITRGNANTNDQVLVDGVAIARGVYNGFYTFRTSATVVNAILGFINPVLFANAAINANKAIQWKKGRDWFDNSETIWNGLTRTGRLEEQTYFQQVWIPCESSQGRLLEFEPIYSSYDRDVACGEWDFVLRTRNVMVNYPSDGFIPSYSQDMPSLPASNRYYINGANHIEVLNMSNSRLNGSPNDATKAEFDNVFQFRNDIFRINRQ
ncbi:hypothetical protein [Belliella pelovolcani]|uniref:hypothetical protein n=1 Tax=Belliella pelovolcani TaxID=529505 RepID=UPI00391ABE96